MAYRMLVTTPNLAFGELIRQSLEQSGDYQVFTSHSSSESIMQCQKSPFDI
jgi:hypothetical protein